MVKQVKPLENKEDKKERIEDKKESVEYESIHIGRKYLFKQVKPLEHEEDKQKRVVSHPRKYKSVGSDTNWNLICYLIIGLIVGIFLLAGGWEIVIWLLYALSGGW